MQRPWGNGSLAACLLKFPFMTWKMQAGNSLEGAETPAERGEVPREPCPSRSATVMRVLRWSPASDAARMDVDAVRLDKTNFQRIAAGLPAKARMVLSAAIALPKGILKVRIPDGRRLMSVAMRRVPRPSW